MAFGFGFIYLRHFGLLDPITLLLKLLITNFIQNKRMRNKKKSEQWFADGCPIPMEKEITNEEFRNKLKRGKTFKGADKILMTETYNALRVAQGMTPKKLNCASCQSEIHRQITIWLSRYDNRTPGQKKICRLKSLGNGKLTPITVLNGSDIDGKLVPSDDRLSMLKGLPYQELVNLAEQSLGERFKELVAKNNNRRNIKKNILISELMNNGK